MSNYREVFLTQKSDEWLEWRNSGIGASDAAILMGALPFQWNDVLNFWKVKTKLSDSVFEENDAIKFGVEYEPVARQKYIDITGTHIEDKCIEREDFPFMRASLDGISNDGKTIVEIKVPGLRNFQKAKSGEVLSYYYSQMQHQAYVSGAQTIHYFVFRPDKGAVLINVPRNDRYIKELVRRAKLFWKCVEKNTPVLPRHFGINPFLEKDPFIVKGMETEIIGVYNNV